MIGRGDGAPVAYLCGLLNSELLDLWYAVRGKTPWHVRRNYEPKRMNEMPYRRPDGDARAEEIAERVRQLAANRRALLPLRASVRDLGRTVKDVWKTGPAEVDRAALLDSLPRHATVSVRLDAALVVEGTPSGTVGRAAADVLVARRGRQETGRVTGDPARLDLLEELLARRDGDRLGSLLLPKDLNALERAATERRDEVVRLLAEGRRLAEEVERLVCRLYDVPDELAEAVVAHAVERAGRSQPA